MFVTIMKQNEPVCSMEVGICSLAGPIIYTYEMIDEKLFPIPLEDYKNERLVKAVLKWWLEQRVISNSDPNLDQTMLEVYDLKPHHYGRMYYYQYIGAFMAYMTSAEDDYWVNPTCPQYLTYALIDPHFINLYICEPIDYITAKTAGGKFKKCLDS